MPLPIDAYPSATQDGRQIELDVVRVATLDYLDFTSTGGSAVATSMLKAATIYSVVATQACIVDFTTIANINPVAAKAVVLLAGERATIMLPVDATGFSAVGLSSSGRLYIQQLTTWAGLANASTLGNQ